MLEVVAFCNPERAQPRSITITVLTFLGKKSAMKNSRVSIFWQYANLYHVSKFPLYLSFTVHYFFAWFSSFTQFSLRKNYFELFFSAYFLFWEIHNLNLTFAVYVKLKHSCISNTVKPRCNEVLCIIAHDFLYPSNCKIYGKELRCSEQIWPFPLPFVVSRFHCIL